MSIVEWFAKRFNSFTIIDADGTPYLRRYYIFKTKWLKVYIHEILRSDNDRDRHDHPWNFTSVILRNGYEEEMLHGTFKRGVGSVIRHKAEDSHKLTLANGNPVWTLFIAGKKRREWGFHTPEGWVHWKPYLDKKFAGHYRTEEEQGLTKFMED